MDQKLPAPSAQGLWAIVDCNNFFASCEVIFRPDLRGRPLVVLSSNDGCVIARSAEAKALGIRMGVPAFQLQKLFAANDVIVFSSNFRLYSTVSRRVMDVLAHFCPRVEQYSIDEAFLYLDGALDRYGAFSLARSEADIDRILSLVRVEEVWGVGRKLARRLPLYGIETAAQLRAADPWRMQQIFSVTLFNTILELRGIPMIDVGADSTTRRTLAASRSFGERVTRIEDLREAVATFTAQALRRLRKEGLVARCIQVRIRTSYFARQPFVEREAEEYLERYSSDTLAFTAAAMRCLEQIYQEGPLYAKAGVLLTDLKRPDQVEGSLLDLDRPPLEERRARLMQVMDRINAKCGPGDARLRLASEGMNKEAPWRTNQAHKSPDYVFDWEPITEEPGSGPLQAAKARKGFPPPNVF